MSSPVWFKSIAEDLPVRAHGTYGETKDKTFHRENREMLEDTENSPCSHDVLGFLCEMFYVFDFRFAVRKLGSSVFVIA